MVGKSIEILFPEDWDHWVGRGTCTDRVFNDLGSFGVIVALRRCVSAGKRLKLTSHVCNETGIAETHGNYGFEDAKLGELETMFGSVRFASTSTAVLGCMW